MVAEKSSVLRSPDSMPSKISFMLSENPMFNISSASSRTTFFTLSSFAAPRFIRSMSRPGVATITWAPCLSECIWFCIDVPPYTGTTLSPPIYLPKSFRSSEICRHSSRVGDRMSACVERSDGSIFCNTGIPYAAVLPVPVWARATTSFLFPSK